MFKDAAIREAELVDRRFAQLTNQWRETANTWFDGTPDSVDRRLAKVDHMIRFAGNSAGRHGSHIPTARALPQLREARAQLLDLRERLLTGSAPMGLQMPREAGARSFEDFDDSLLTD